MENKREVMFLKGKESIIVSLLLLLAIIVFIVPIVLVLILRSIVRLIQSTREQAKVPEGVNANFEKLY